MKTATKKDVKKIVTNLKGLGMTVKGKGDSILNHFSVDEKGVMTTDCRNWGKVEFFHELSKGLYTYEGMKTNKSTEDYPEYNFTNINTKNKLAEFVIPANDLWKLSQVVTDDDTRYFLKGVTLHNDDRLYATDGRQLLEVKTTDCRIIKQDKFQQYVTKDNPIIKLPTFKKSQKFLVTVEVYEIVSMFTFQMDGFEYKLTTDNIEGQFPQVNRIIRQCKPEYQFLIEKPLIELGKLDKDHRSNRIVLSNRTLESAFTENYEIKTDIDLAVKYDFVKFAYENIGDTLLIEDAFKPVEVISDNYYYLFQPLQLY